MADGKVIIDTELDNSGFKKAVGSLSDSLDKISSIMKGSVQPATNKAFLSAQQKAKETEIAIRAVQAQMEEIRSSAGSAGAATSKSFENAKQKVEENRIAMGALEEKMQEIAEQKSIEIGEFYTNPESLDAAVGEALSKDKGYQKLGSQYDKLLVKHQQLISRMQEAEKASVSMSGTSSKEYQKLEKQLDSLVVKLAQYRSRMDGASQSSAKVEKGTNKASSSMKKMEKTSIPLTASLFKVTNMLKLMALRMVLRSAIQAAIKGFQDLAKVTPSFNRSMSAISTEFLRLRNALTTAIAPALTALTPIIVSLTSTLSQALNTLAAFTARLFGNAASYKKAAKAAVDYSASANKVKNSLAGFDDLEVLSNDKESGMPDASQMFEEVEIPKETMSWADSVKEKLMDMLEPLKKIDFSNLSSAFERLKKAASSLGGTVWAGIEWVYYNLLIPIAEWTIEDGLPAFLDLLSAGFSLLDSVLKPLQPLGDWLLNTFLNPLREWSNKIIIKSLDMLTKSLEKVSKWISKNEGIVLTFGKIVGTVALAFGVGAIAVAAWNVVCGIATIVTGAFGAVITFLTSPITLVTLAIGALILAAVWLYENWDIVKEKALECWNGVVNAFKSSGEWFSQKVVEPIRKFFADLWSWLVKLASDTWSKVSGIWKVVADWFHANVVMPVSTFFANMWDGIKNSFTIAWEFMSASFKSYINGWINLLEGFINFVIDGVNMLIKALNKISISVPSWVPGIGGQSWGINISSIPNVKIPRLAQGAVIPPNKEFMAVLGDQKHGTNLEGPLDLFKQGMLEVISESGLLNQRGSGDIILQVDGKTFARLIGPYQNAEKRRRGVKLVTGGV